MSSWVKPAFIIIGIGLFINFVSENLYTKLPVVIDGEVDADFEDVRTMFLKNFNDGWERDGSALAVFIDGKKVVDLWGGYADRQAARKWNKDTMTVTFSTTKAVAALCIATLVERGRLSYDDLVSKHWPGFAKNGKQNVTVQWALSHMAGLAYMDVEITEEMARDHEKMRVALENEPPKWPPGTRSGYHAYTYGWIVDQIVRHTDEKKRSIGTFFREEIAQPNGIDYFIGLPPQEEHRVARITVPTIWERVSEVLTDYRVIQYFASLWKLMQDTPLARVASNPPWLQAVAKCTVNNPDYHQLEQAAALGIGNARSLAQLFSLVATRKILNQSTLDELQKHFVNETDLVFSDRVAKGHGFLYQPLHRADTKYLVGHTGHGCQQVAYDINNRLSIAYVTNGLKTGLYDLCRTYWRLQTAVYDVVEKKKGMKRN